MSKLTIKQESYPHYRGISFDESSYTLTPSKTGSKTFQDETPALMNNALFVRDGGQDPTISDGPIPGQNSYKFTFNNITGKSSRLYFGSTSSGTTGSQGDIRRTYWDGFGPGVERVYSIWVKMPDSVGSLVGTTGIHRVLYGNSPMIGLGVGTSVNSSTPAISLSHVAENASLTATYTSSNSQYPINFGEWYLVSIVKSKEITGGSSTVGNTGTGNLTYKHYINGVLVGTLTAASFTNVSINMITWGHNSSATPVGSDWSVSLAGWFSTDWSDIGENGLQEIYATFSNSTIIADVFTATSFQTEPTIIVSSNDYTQITTSFIASAEIPSNIVTLGQTNKNIIITELLEASADINHASINTPISISFSPDIFIASAQMTEAFVSRQPMTASALLGNHSVSVTPSYFNLIKNLNPYLYIFNGQSEANIINYGYQNGTFVKGSDLLTNQTSPFPLDFVAEGKSWKGSASNNSDGYITFETTNYGDSFNNLVGTGNFAYEVWVNPQEFPNNDEGTINVDYAIINSEKLKLILEEATGSIFSFTPRKIALSVTGSNQVLRTNLDSTPLNLNNWNHIVINVYQSGINANQRLIQLWINGQIIFNQNVTFTTFTDNIDKINFILGSNATSLRYLSDMYYDELAIYSAPLTNSQIIQHYNFISTLSPNYNFNASTITVNSTFGNHQFLIISNANAIATPITASADFVMPSVLATKVINYSAPALTASALNTDVIIYYGRTMLADPAIAFAESKEGFALNTTYYDYVQANIAPYRYVSFDSANPYIDFGSDADYSVVPTAVGGIIVNPDLGINGKSAKTAGISYITDGVILKESEHDDNWGTGNNSWHSSFWMERATDDASTTGLRVLWNLNGAYDDQNVILYHYQNKLHLQINNQISAPITITSANNVNIFDYTRHNIVINSHHNNNKNYVYVYVDAVLVLDQDINSYAVTTINNPIHVGANDEANNFPRLSVGCLITPFADTALPVIPTNTKLIVDEVYWDKNQILQTAVTNIFNVMPDKTNTNNATIVFTASAEMSMPAIITNAILSAAPATASGQFVHPSLYLVRLVNVAANVMEASALMAEATGFVPVNIVSNVMVANAIFNTSLTATTIPGPTMYASAILKSQGIYLTKDGSTTRYYPNRQMTPWLAYLRATSTEKILPMREVV